MKKNSKKWLVLLLAAVMVCAFAGNAMAATAATDFDINEFKSLIKTYFYMPYDEKVLETNDLDKIMAELAKHDDYATYFSPKEYTEFLRDMDNIKTGIGVVCLADSQGLKIEKVMAEGPASKAGLKAGDIITAVNNIALAGKDLDQMTEPLGQAKGTVLQVTVLREATILHYSITLDYISDLGVLSAQEDKVGFITLTSFNTHTAAEVERILAEFKADGITHLVLSLENNTGGSLDACYAVADMFLKDTVINFEKGKAEQQIIRANDDKSYGESVPLLVVVNEGTGSAAEILATALADNGRAQTLGSKTYGVGYYKYAFELADGSGIFFIGGENIRPNGTCLARTGGYVPNITEANMDELNRVFETLLSGVSSPQTLRVTMDSTAATLNGKAIKLDMAPIKIGNTTYLPLRNVAEQLGNCLQFRSGERNYFCPTVNSFGKTVLLDPVKKQVESNGVLYDVEVFEKDGSLYVSSAFFAKYLGYEVTWDGASHTITLCSGDAA